MTKRKSKPDVRDARQPPDPQNLRPPRGRNRIRHAPGLLTSVWVRVAEAACPGFTQILGQATKDLVRAGVFSQYQGGQDAILQSLRSVLAPVVFHIALVSPQRSIGRTPEREALPADHLHQSNPRADPTVVYVVFHEGRSHVYYDELPAEVLDLRGHVLFWIDHATNEVWVRDKQLEEKEQLQPKAEEMLRYLCQIGHAGQTISLSKLYEGVWTPAALPERKAIRNNIGFHQNAINTFAAEKFILTLPPKAQQDPRSIVRLRGADAYTIGREVHKELCVIWRFPCQ